MIFMREIIFRAKSKSNNEWMYMSLFCGFFTQNRLFAHIGTKSIESGFSEEIIPDTLCQYIGRNDKFGNPIFEGDIVRTQYGRLCSVVWFGGPNDIGWDLKPIEDKHPYPDAELWNSQYLEVVGNIFDDGETINKKRIR